MALQCVLGPVAARGVEHDVHVVFAPSRIGRRETVVEGDLFRAVMEAAVAVDDFDREAPIDLIVFEEVGQGVGFGDVGYCDDVHVVPVVQQSEDIAADPAETH